MENSTPGKMKRMSRVEEVGKIKSPEKPVGEALKDARGVSGCEVMSGMHQLISLKKPGRGSIEGGMSGVNVGGAMSRGRR